eukprot:4879629-Pyramimonas_sp.AAC.2
MFLPCAVSRLRAEVRPSLEGLARVGVRVERHGRLEGGGAGVVPVVLHRVRRRGHRHGRADGVLLGHLRSARGWLG